MPEISDFRLRTLEERDLPQILQWRNSDRIRANMYTDHEITREEHQSWFERVADDPTVCFLVLDYCDSPAGLVYFTDIDRASNRCEWGFYLGDESLPAGSGTIMGYLALQYIFVERRLRKVYGEVLDFNEASQRFFSRLGFSRDGVLRRHVMKNGRYADVVLFCLLEDEWEGEHREQVEALITQREAGATA